MKNPFLQKSEIREWLFKVLIALLLFALLVWAVWWYFEYRMAVIKATYHF